MSNVNYLGFMRRRCDFSVEDLATLLDFADADELDRFERGDEIPTLEFALACEFAFGIAPRSMFHGLYEDVQRIVLSNAGVLDEALSGKTDESSKMQRRFLAIMRERAGRHPAV